MKVCLYKQRVHDKQSSKPNCSCNVPYDRFVIIFLYKSAQAPDPSMQAFSYRIVLESVFVGPRLGSTLFAKI